MKSIAQLAVVLAAAFTFNAQAAEPLNTKCPITHDAASPAITSTYTKKIEFCCEKCKGKFDASPKAYMIQVKSAHKGQCPLSNKASKPGFESTYTRQVAFKDAAAKAKFDSAPDQYIGEVKQ